MSVIALLSTVALASPPTAADPFGSDDTGVEISALDEVPAGVTGGDPVEAGDWEDCAAVYQGTSAYDVVCTGVLVAPDVVLTAGHCVGGLKQVKLKTNDYTKGGEVIAVSKTIEYPNSWNNYDVAVLMLAEESTVEPRVIARDCIRDEIVDGADVAVVGYGALDRYGNQYGTRMMEGFTVITDADCSHTDWGCNASVSPNGELGAGEDGVDACYGDSGGPLYLLTDRGEYLVGITSRGWYGADCGDGGVYVRPDAIVDWIEEVSGRTLPRPVCGEPPDPIAAPIYVPKNEAGFTTIDPRDPDGDSGITYTIARPPTSGGAEVMEDGSVRYQPETGFLGDDSVLVTVTDAEGLSADVEIAVKVLKKGAWKRATGQGGCGCSVPGAAGGGWLFALLGLVFARRRR